MKETAKQAAQDIAKRYGSRTILERMQYGKIVAYEVILPGEQMRIVVKNRNGGTL